MRNTEKYEQLDKGGSQRKINETISKNNKEKACLSAKTYVIPILIS